MQNNRQMPWTPLQTLLVLLMPGIGVACFALLLGMPRALMYRFVWAIAYAALVLGTRHFLLETDRRFQLGYGIAGGLFALTQALGFRLQHSGGTGWVGLALCLGVGIGLAPALGFGFGRVADRLARVRPSEHTLRPRVRFWLAFCIILLGWLPVFLAYYPGLFAYDVATQIGEIISGKLTNRNPLLHTLFLGGFYQLGGLLGSHTLGIALSVLCQMALMAAIFAYMLNYLAGANGNRAAWWVSLVWLALFPTHAMLAISCTKDTLFSGLMLLYAVRLHALTRNPALLARRRWFAATLGLIALLCLMRNNAFFGILLCLPLGMFALPRTAWRRLAALVGGGLLLYLGVSAGLKTVLAADGVNQTELVSLPSQQMARVYALHQDTLPASVEIAYYLPTVQDYTPHSADAVKTFANVRRPGRLWGFAKLWGKLGLQFPMEYLDAFLLNTQGYWWLDDTSHAAIYGQGLATRQGYLLSDTKPGFNVMHQSLLPPLETLYEQLFSANDYQRLPVISLLFAPALYLWLTFFALVRAWHARQRGRLLLGTFLLCYFLPFLFGACALIRYVYPLICCMPLLLWLPEVRAASPAPAAGSPG
ncbi:MAG: DUF6020 family protein [Candidatus Limiplasma sp.]|nr:DUF6020 family protein [Candidatus Limiplasma sp.]